MVTSNMTKEERHEAIMDQFFKQNVVLVSDLADKLGVSSVTIRKDLTELEKEGKLYRSHGKAIAINPFANNRSVNEKEHYCPEEKHRIGMEATKLIEDNDSIIIASGTTIHAFANCITTNQRLTVVSASLQASVSLAKNENVDIIQLGEKILEDCSFSKLFIGVDGIDLDFGISTTDMREAHLNQKMIKAAQHVIVLADSTKFGRRGFAKICDMDTVDTIITDSNIRPADRNRIEELGIELIIAEMKD